MKRAVEGEAGGTPTAVSGANGHSIKRPKVDVQAERRRLPIFPARQRLIEELSKNRVSVIVAETGSGKTTREARTLDLTFFFHFCCFLGLDLVLLPLILLQKFLSTCWKAIYAAQAVSPSRSHVE